MRKKFLLLFVALCMVMSSFGGDLKKSVCIVRSNDQEMDSLSLRLGDILQRNGYIAAGKSLLKGVKSYGSGFVFQAESGSCYVITNRHVVKNARTVQLEFKSDNDSKVYEGCSVLFVNLKQDVAVIALPANADVIALKSMSTPLVDGREVYTAGFPALGGSPLWQYGKGIVSNADVNTGSVGDKDSVFVIQHTAQVDPGNSGGPLLVQNVESGDTTYFVAGINTWQALWRENTNYSTRIAELEYLIKKYEQNSKASDALSLNETAEKFVQDVSKGYRSVVKYLSTKMLMGLSDFKLIDLLKETSDSISDVIRSEDPIYGMKLLVAKEMCSRIKKGASFQLQSANDNGNESGTTIYTLDKSKVTIDWVQSLDGWTISKSSISGNDSKGSGYNNRNSRSRFSLGVTTIVPIHESQGTGFMLDYISSYKYFLYGVSAGVRATHGIVTNGYYFKSNSSNSYYPSANWGLAWEMGMGGQFPFHKKKFTMVPYLLIQGGGEYAVVYGHSKEMYIFLQLKAVFRLGYVFNNGNMLYIAPQYKFRPLCLDLDKHAPGFKHVVGIGIGFEWINK